MPGQGIVALAHKTAAVPQWPGVVTSTGSTFNVTLFSAGLAQKFTSWDAMIAGAESELPGMVAGYGLRVGGVEADLAISVLDQAARGGRRRDRRRSRRATTRSRTAPADSASPSAATSGS